MLGLHRQRALVAFAAGALVVAGVLALVVSRRAWRRSGADGTPVQLVIGTLPAGAVGCQPHEPLPPGTRAVRIHAAPAAPGAVAVRVALRAGGRYSGVGPAGAAAGAGTVVAALAHPITSAAVATLCVWNTGQAPLALAGAATGPADQLTVAATANPALATVGRVRVEDLEHAAPTALFSVLGGLPERVATATGSALAPWLAVVGLIGTLLLTVALLWMPGGAGEA